jgi:hypothetical protein
MWHALLKRFANGETTEIRTLDLRLRISPSPTELKRIGDRGIIERGPFAQKSFQLQIRSGDLSSVNTH